MLWKHEAVASSRVEVSDLAPLVKVPASSPGGKLKLVSVGRQARGKNATKRCAPLVHALQGAEHIQ